jgi:hypothetical protein
MPSAQRGNLESGAIWRIYAAADITANIDLRTSWPGYATGRYSKMPRAIKWIGGDLVLKDAAGVSKTWPEAMGGDWAPLTSETIIDSSTTATYVGVIW